MTRSLKGIMAHNWIIHVVKFKEALPHQQKTREKVKEWIQTPHKVNVNLSS